MYNLYTNTLLEEIMIKKILHSIYIQNVLNTICGITIAKIIIRSRIHVIVVKQIFLINGIFSDLNVQLFDDQNNRLKIITINFLKFLMIIKEIIICFEMEIIELIVITILVDM